jgi:bifunctional DNA primase/polymerase-like protein
VTMLDAALAFAARNWPVLPCIARMKVPAIKGGFYSATTNPETIKRYWRRSDCNIGIRTGAASGFWVVDIDGEEGEASLRALEATHGALPPTREVITGGGGRHLWFKYVGPVKSAAGQIALGIDTRADNAYIICPPSIHPNGRRYEWSVDSTDELATAPGWLVELARKKPAPSISERALATVRRPAGGSANAYGAAALDDEIAALATTPPGARNHALNAAAFSLFQLVAGGELDESEVIGRLVQAAHANGLMTDDGLAKVWATIQSARRAGMQSPRSRPGAA